MTYHADIPVGEHQNLSCAHTSGEKVLEFALSAREFILRGHHCDENAGIYEDDRQ
jgi:hypothetical protein